jgi:hypothetical protein
VWIVQTELLKRLFSLCLAMMWRHKIHIGPGDEVVPSEQRLTRLSGLGETLFSEKRSVHSLSRECSEIGMCGGLAGLPLSILQEDTHDRSDATLTEVITASVTKVLAGRRSRGCSAGVRRRQGTSTHSWSPVAANTHRVHIGSRTLTPPPAT